MHGRKNSFSVKVLLDGGSGIIAVSELIATRMGHFYGQSVTRLSQASTVRGADGATTTIKEITQAVHSGYGPVVLRNKVLAVIPGTDDVLIVGFKTLRDDLNIDVKQSFEDAATKQVELRISGLEQEPTSLRQVCESA
ncbi:unnamed protein product, partial [Discosporangium mesarthrocarpum]